MKEQFNFYDVYGYLIPGFALLGFLWLPFGLVYGEAPSLGFADAVGGLLAAYVLGHVLSSLAARALPSGRRVSREDVRLPSDDMLDKELRLNPVKYIELVERKIKEEFGIDLCESGISSKEALALRRKAFFLCRDRLVVEGKGAYAEQFQGLYTMMRGVCGASLIAVYYLLGWLAGALPARRATAGIAIDGVPEGAIFAGLLFVGMDFWFNRSWKRPGSRGSTIVPGTSQVVAQAQPLPCIGKQVLRRLPAGVRWVHDCWAGIALSFSVAVAFFAGWLRVHGPLARELDYSLFTALTISILFLVGRFYAGYVYFANIFAETVIRSFLALPEKPGTIPA